MAVYPRAGDTEVPAQPDFPALERDVLEHWRVQDTFRASVEQRPEDNEYVFKQILGLDDAQYERLIVEGVAVEDYLDPQGNPY